MVSGKGWAVSKWGAYFPGTGLVQHNYPTTLPLLCTDYKVLDYSK